MSGRNEAREVEAVARLERTQVLRAADGVIRHARPIAARIAQSPVFEIPHRRARARECRAKVGRLIEVDRISPGAAVKKDNGWMRGGTAWKVQVAELRRVLTV